MIEEPEIETTILAETRNYRVWSAKDPDEEVVYNVELGPVTMHFYQEEWEEFLELIHSLPPR